MLRKVGKKSDEAKCIIEISESINKAWIAFFDDMTQCVLWHLFHKLFSAFVLFPTLHLLILLKMSFDISKLVQKRVVFKNFKILQVIIGLVSTLEFLGRLTRIDAFQDTETSEVLQTQL